MTRKYDWSKLYEKYRCSGLSKRKFAKEKGISESLVYSQLRRFEEEPEKETIFAPITIVPPDAENETTTSLKNETQNPEPESIQNKLAINYKGIQLMLDKNSDLELVKQILAMAGEVCFE